MPTLPDTGAVGDEMIEVTLGNPANGTLGDNAVHTYTIRDGDNAPSPAADADR